MASVVGSVTEEAGFRGYLQVALERDVGGIAAIVIAALVIAPAHGLTQGFLWPVLLFYFLVDVMLGVTAYLTKSILPGIVVHAIGLMTFFTLVWPNDSTRRAVATFGSADAWFWVHCAQAVVFGIMAFAAFRHLAEVTSRSERK